MKGKLIVLEGLDGSGKETQANLLSSYLKDKNIATKKISFPDYENPSSLMVQMLLNGDFNENSHSLSPYVSSTFFSVDRVVSYLKSWQNLYLSGRIIVADRYTTSNEIYQTVNLPPEKINQFINWLEDFEYNKLEIPRPDLVIYLDMPVELSQQLITSRYSGDSSKKDIYEKDIDFLRKCRVSALRCVESFNWKLVKCSTSSSLRTIDSIHEDIVKIVKDFLSS